MEPTINSPIYQIIACDEIIVNILKHVPVKSFFNFVTTCKNLNNRKFTLLTKLLNFKKELTFKKKSKDLSLIKTIKTLNQGSLELENSYHGLKKISFDEEAFHLTNLLQVVKSSEITTLKLKLKSEPGNDSRLETIRQIALKVGKSLENLDLDSTNEFQETFIFLEHCPHLKIISICGVQKILEVIQRAAIHLKQLEWAKFNRPYHILQEISVLRITEEHSSGPLSNFIKENKGIKVLTLENIPFSFETALHIINDSAQLKRFPLIKWERFDAEDLLINIANTFTLSVGEPATILSKTTQAVIEKKVLLKNWAITTRSPQVESLTIESPMNLTSEEIVTTVNHCPNLNSLNIKKSKITEEDLNQIITNCLTLKSLTLDNCSKVKGSFINENNTSIETLHLTSILTTDSTIITKKETEALTKTISNCASLKNLTLISMSTVTPEMIGPLLKQNNLLKTLHLVDCFQIDSVVIDHQMNHLTELVFYPPGVMEIEITINAPCPKLKEIQFNTIANNPIFILNGNCPHLEKLYLKDTKLNWDQIKPIIDNCKELKELHLNNSKISFENAKTILTESPSLEFVSLPSFTKEENQTLKELAATHHCNLI